MRNQPEYRTIAEYMKAVDGMFNFVRDEIAEEHKREIEAHLRQLVQHAILEGMSAQEAEREAIKRFGSPFETVAPLVRRYLNTDGNSSDYFVKQPWYSIIPGVLISSIPGVLIGLTSYATIYTSSRPVLLTIAVTMGILGGVLMAFAWPIQTKGVIPEPMIAKIREQLREYPDATPTRNATYSARINRQSRVWLYRKAMEYYSADRSPLASINIRFFAAYGLALLIVAFLPIPSTYPAIATIMLLMSQSITIALRQHFAWCRPSR